MPWHTHTVSTSTSCEVRKLASGDLLELLDGPTESNGLQRVFARCVADGQEGWHLGWCVFFWTTRNKDATNGDPGHTTKEQGR